MIIPQQPSWINPLFGIQTPTYANLEKRIAALESELAAMKAKAQPEAAKEEQKECDCGYCQRRYGLGCSRKIEAEAKRIIGELKVEQEAIRSERGLKPKTTGLTFMEAVAAMGDGDKKGESVRRNGKNWFLRMTRSMPYIRIFNFDGSNGSGSSGEIWCADPSDITATDWEIVP